MKKLNLIWFLFVSAAVGLAIASECSPADAQSAGSAEQKADPVKSCMPNKVLAYWKRPQPAEELAYRIAQECAELLPQSSSEDCGVAQARCDAIQQEYNANMRTGMERYAYRMIVGLRQGAK